MKNLAQHRAAVENAAATLATKRAALHRNGQAIYSPEEQQRRDAEAEAGFRRTFTDAAEAAQAEIADAEDELQRLDRAEADPIATLTADDLTKANARAAFIREDAESLPVAALADRAEEAATGGDRATWALILRYASRRIETERAKPGGGYSDDLMRLEAALNTVRTRLYPDHADTRGALTARIAAASQLQTHATTMQFIAQRYGGR